MFRGVQSQFLSPSVRMTSAAVTRETARGEYHRLGYRLRGDSERYADSITRRRRGGESSARGLRRRIDGGGYCRF